ncbi:MAG: hypothetical protein H6Q02_500 [Acidobacteria bacterium]|nr:hypothetical protein [Acidobacteriota bacterium]
MARQRGQRHDPEAWLRLTITRRTLTRALGLGAATLYLQGCIGRSSRPGAARQTLPPELAGISPIDRSLPERGVTNFSGDAPDRPHRALWDKQAYLAARGGALPEPEERVPLVVIGGGIAGLSSAYLLREHRPVVLEQAPRFGGNSRGEAWRGIDYATGAAYFIEPDEGSAIASLLDELGLATDWRVKTTEDPVVVAGKRYDEFWDGHSDPGRRDQFELLKRHFLALLEESGDLQYPEIPVSDATRRASIDALDRESFAGYLERIAGGPLHPHIAAAVEHYCWSSFGASSGELGAASGLNFYAAEFGNVCVLPGGNAAVAERLLEQLADAPKFVVGKLIDDLEPERRNAIARLRYRAYLVANVLLERPLGADFYDLFLAGNGGADLANVERDADRQRATDVVVGTFARAAGWGDVLTLYRSFPYEGGRMKLFEEEALARYRQEMTEQVQGEILPLLGIQPSTVAELRLARWGHALPVADRGLIAERVVDTLRAPWRERVFFVQQDNWALPAFETAVTEALLWAPAVRRLLG